MEGAQPNRAATYDYYRCDCTWRDLHEWLRGKGVRQKKEIHSLRKESGSLIASNFGIEAAGQHLGHRDIRTTSSHYVEKKKRIEVQLPLPAEAQTNPIASECHEYHVFQRLWRDVASLQQSKSDR